MIIIIIMTIIILVAIVMTAFILSAAAVLELQHIKLPKHKESNM